jgi:hypothetical protein
MNTVTVYISNEELNVLEEIFKAEPDFAPRTKEDYVLVGLMRQILNGSKIKDVQVLDVEEKV